MAEVTEKAFEAITAQEHLFPIDNAVGLDVRDGVPVLRASNSVQARIEALLQKQETQQLSVTESQELDVYVELDDLLSLLNRMTRNLLLNQSAENGVSTN